MPKEKLDDENLLTEIVDAWESLGEGNYSNKDIGKWLSKDMKPVMDKIRIKLGRPIEK